VGGVLLSNIVDSDNTLFFIFSPLKTKIEHPKAHCVHACVPLCVCMCALLYCHRFITVSTYDRKNQSRRAGWLSMMVVLVVLGVFFQRSLPCWGSIPPAPVWLACLFSPCPPVKFRPRVSSAVPLPYEIRCSSPPASLTFCLIELFSQPNAFEIITYGVLKPLPEC
jgi:hypothetical protein